MLVNYLKTAFRNLWRNKVFSIIKILGLSIGLTVCMLIFLYTKDEISFDQFHKNKAHLFRIIQSVKVGDMQDASMGITTSYVGEAFSREIPEIQQYIRVNGESVIVKNKSNEVLDEQALAVDDNFFRVFSFPLIQGSSGTALKDMHSVVLSKDMAKKYFGTEDAIGETLQIERNDQFENYTVTAIAENSPQNSTIKGDIFFAMKKDRVKAATANDWIGGSVNTFLLISPTASIKAVQQKIQNLFDKNTREFLAQAKKEQGIDYKATFALQPIADMHLSSTAGPGNGLGDGSSSTYSYILTCIAIFILIIACINFINLAIAQSLKRGKEIGIRKVIGGTRSQLIRQFLSESFVVSLIAFIIAMLLTGALLPYFSQLANKKLSLSYLADWYLYGGFFLLLLVTSFLSGFYPSLVLSSFQPVKVLYGRQKFMSRSLVTKGLIVLQFALAIFLIIGTIAINYQLHYLLRTNLGYDSKNLVLLKTPYSNQSDRLSKLLKAELQSQPNIQSVALRNGGRNIQGAKANGKNIMIEFNKIDDQYLPTFRIPIIAGRNFSPAYPGDSNNSVIVNETFLKEAGWKLSEAIGKKINYMDEKRRATTIVGVVKDYHFSSLKEKITAELFAMDSTVSYGQIWVKIDSKNIPQTLSILESSYKKLNPLFPYSYEFMDALNAKNYQVEAKWRQIVSIASGLFVFISCIGLLGLVMLAIEQRTKEIGIRKVLGAAVSRIFALVSKEFIVLILIALLIASPVAYYFIHRWLQDFPYRVSIAWWIFPMAGLAVLALAMITLSYQAIKAAVANPVKSLRNE